MIKGVIGFHAGGRFESPFCESNRLLDLPQEIDIGQLIYSENNYVG